MEVLAEPTGFNLVRAVLSLLFITAACTLAVPTAAPSDIAVADERSPITMPLSLYVVAEARSDNNGATDFSSTRTVAEVEAIGARINELWSPDW